MTSHEATCNLPVEKLLENVRALLGRDVRALEPPRPVRLEGVTYFTRSPKELQFVGAKDDAYPEGADGAGAARKGEARFLVDVGANHGTVVGGYMAAMRARGLACEALVFEPARVGDCLARTIEANGWQDTVALERVAIGAESKPEVILQDGLISLWSGIGGQTTEESIGRLERLLRANTTRAQFEAVVDFVVPIATHLRRTVAVRCPQRTLAEALRAERFRDRPIDLLKLDIEGHELPALEGAGPEVLRRTAVVVSEVHDVVELARGVFPTGYFAVSADEVARGSSKIPAGGTLERMIRLLAEAGMVKFELMHKPPPWYLLHELLEIDRVHWDSSSMFLMKAERR